MSKGPLDALVDALPFATLLLDGNGRILHANRMVERLTGQALESLIDESFFGAFASLAGVEQARKRFEEGASHQDLWESIACELPRSAEPGLGARIHLRSLQDQRQPRVLALFELVEASAGDQREMQELESCVRRVRKIKHEISNPLMSLMGLAELLHDDPALPDKTRERIGMILEQSRRIREQIRELSKVGRRPSESG